MTFTKRLAVLVCATAFVLVPATVAQAAPAGRHCVVSVAPGATMTCYPSFATAISKATGGRVTDAPDDAKAALRDEGFAAKLNKLGRAPAIAPTAMAASDIVISIEYSSTGYSGSSLVVTGTHSCDDAYGNPVEFELTSMPDGWNDEIESFRGYANCAAQHFLHIGASIDYGPGDNGFYYYRSSFLSWLSDEISSIAWS